MSNTKSPSKTVKRSSSESDLFRYGESVSFNFKYSNGDDSCFINSDEITCNGKSGSDLTSSEGSDKIVNGEIEDNATGGDDNKLSWGAFKKLRGDLERAQQELHSRDNQCRELSRVRDVVDQEIEELTASLFEEAHKMVHEANVGRASAEKKLYETQLKLDGLQAEVAALKMLVITSTPANPSNHVIKKSSSASQLCSYCDTYYYATDNTCSDWAMIDPSNKKEVDPVTFQCFVSWIENGCRLKDDDFLSLILKDDISPCLRFSNIELSKSVYKAVQNNTLAIEPIQSKPKKCALSNIFGHCPYRILMADSDQWYPITASCRARIVSVIDFLTFLRYIRQGILKKDINVLYWQMMKQRADISLCRLGMERKAVTKK